MPRARLPSGALRRGALNGNRARNGLSTNKRLRPLPFFFTDGSIRPYTYLAMTNSSAQYKSTAREKIVQVGGRPKRAQSGGTKKR